jgi:CysZ protein
MIKKILGGFGTIAGATYPIRALIFFLEHRHLWGYIVVPMLINFVIGIFLYTQSIEFGLRSIDNLEVGLAAWVTNSIASLPRWLSFLNYLDDALIPILRFVLIVGLLSIVGVVLLQFGNILGAPWYGKLSEEIETLRKGKLTVVEVGFLRDIGRALLHEVKKLILTLGVGICLFALGFFPVFGTLLATLGWIALAGTIVCLDFFDGALERRKLHFRDKIKIIYSNIPATASFGLVCLALISIPLVNLLVIPLCIAAGTLFVCDRVLPRLDVNRERNQEIRA